MQVVSIQYVDELPMRPVDAEFGITIDFSRGKSDPVQVFGAMTDLLSAFSQIDRVLIGAVDPTSDSFTVIEDVEAESITAWVRNKISLIDDQALKEFDPKQQIGVYAVKAKYRIIEYLDSYEKKVGERRLHQLRKDLEALAAPISRQIISPSIDMGALLQPMNQIQHAKSRLSNGEKVVLKSDIESDYDVDTAATSEIKAEDPPQVKSDAGGEMELQLLIKKPDLIGKSQWDFKHDKMAISANIEDLEWLEKFHRLEVTVMPGASMRATVKYKYEYDGRGRVISSKFEISKVHEIIPPSPPQRDIFSLD